MNIITLLIGMHHKLSF